MELLPHSRALPKPRCTWIQWLGQHGNRGSGRTALLSASDHPVQPHPPSPPLLWGLLPLTEKALRPQRNSFLTRRDKLPSISVQGHCYQHIFFATLHAQGSWGLSAEQLQGTSHLLGGFCLPFRKGSKSQPLLLLCVCLQIKNRNGNELVSVLSVIKFKSETTSQHGMLSALS